MHDAVIGGHSGAPATYSKLKHIIYWTGMKSNVYAYVKACAICQHAKPDRAR